MIGCWRQSLSNSWSRGEGARCCVFVKTPDRVRFVASRSNCHSDHSTNAKACFQDDGLLAAKCYEPFGVKLGSTSKNRSRLKKMSLLWGIADSAILPKHVCNTGNLSWNVLMRNSDHRSILAVFIGAWVERSRQRSFQPSLSFTRGNTTENFDYL